MLPELCNCRVAYKLCSVMSLNYKSLNYRSCVYAEVLFNLRHSTIPVYLEPG